jgi:exodeoxyribonuclease VII large subunit
LEERKKKLAAEGLFEAARKRPLPYLPEVIGIVTSPTGAVIRDILHRLAERFPRRVLVWPVAVQGEGAAEQVARAIEGFNALPERGPVPRPDLLIVARGGGSLEDLWAFNEERVVRAAAASRIPLISAVGHETDTTLIDFASDKRAPTPSAAAEIAVPVRAELQREVIAKLGRMVGALARVLQFRRERIAGLARGLGYAPGLVQSAGQRLDDRSERLHTALHGRLSRIEARLSGRTVPHPRQVLAVKRERADSVAARLARTLPPIIERLDRRIEMASRLLESHSYREVLKRGYVVVRDATGKPIRAAAAVAVGNALSLEFTDGVIGATATEGAAPAPAAKRSRKGGGDGRQGSLL